MSSSNDDKRRDAILERMLKTPPKPREDSGKRKQSPAKDKPKKERPAK